jgi:dynein heavy chain
MARVAKERNCYRALIGGGQNFLKFLADQNYKLESIQKRLQDFLRSKRVNFPRFYFLSDDDLLEIIG